MSRLLPPGKVPWDVIASHVQARLPAGVLLGPAAGEDAALVELGNEVWAVASDPISFTANDVGRLAVIVNANDVAARGAEPLLFVAVVMLAPAEATEERVTDILDQIQTTCSEVGASLIGGHSEVTPGLEHSLVVGTMLGRVVGRPITSGGLRPGDRVGMTRWAGIEGTAILLAELGERLDAELGCQRWERRDELMSGDWLSVVPAARVAAAEPAVSALHDVTEGGVGEALYELARAAGVEIDAGRDDVPVLQETAMVCEALGIDPLGLIGSGALLVGCGEEGATALESAYHSRGIPFSWIGRALPADARPRQSVPRFPSDEILKAVSCEDLEAVLFDMDGTLIDSEYDWQSIRRRLGIEGPSIIDQLNELPEPEREAKWRELESIERHATRAAGLKHGVVDLLTLLQRRGVATALVTNNGAENTRFLLDRFGLEFDAVLTRDDGLWKPSGEPVAEAIRRLGARPERTATVGDSRYDIAAAREAGCGLVVVLYDGASRYREDADLAFADIEGLTRYLRIVL